VVYPEAMIDKYGADAVRWFMLSDSPPERDVIWSEAGIGGAARFMHRIEKLLEDYQQKKTQGKTQETELYQFTATCLDEVGRAIEGLKFNRAVAFIYTFVNQMEGFAPSLPAYEKALETLFLMIAPAAPHLAEKGWQELGKKGLIAQAAWPEAEIKYLKKDTMTLAVQVNGKKRGLVELPKGADQKMAEEAALALEAVQRQIQTGHKKIIYVPERIINVLV
jgi:leucyl-tRNA synthetase